MSAQSGHPMKALFSMVFSTKPRSHFLSGDKTKNIKGDQDTESWDKVLLRALFSRHKNRSAAISSSCRKLSAALEIRPIRFGAVSCTNSKRNLKIPMSDFFNPSLFFLFINKINLCATLTFVIEWVVTQQI